MAAIWRHSIHGGSELLMLLAIADFADDDGHAYPAVSTLASKCRMTPRNANLLLAKLRDSGELAIRVGAGPRGCNAFQVKVGAASVALATAGRAAPEADFTPEAGFTPEASFTLKAASATPEAGFPNTLKPASVEPSLNRKEPPVARKRAAAGAFDAATIPLPEWLPRECWSDWIEDRQERRKPVTERAAKHQIAALTKYRAEGHDPADVIAHSIAGSYQGLFAPSADRGKTSGSSASADSFKGAL